MLCYIRQIKHVGGEGAVRKAPPYMKKRMFCLCLVAAMACSILTGCSGNTETETTTSSATTSSVSELENDGLVTPAQNVVDSETIENEDGSVTVNETLEDGTVISTTTAEDGSVVQTQTNTDGTVTETRTDSQGNKTVITTDSQGNTTTTEIKADGTQSTTTTPAPTVSETTTSDTTTSTPSTSQSTTTSTPSTTPSQPATSTPSSGGSSGSSGGSTTTSQPSTSTGTTTSQPDTTPTPTPTPEPTPEPTPDPEPTREWTFDPQYVCDQVNARMGEVGMQNAVDAVMAAGYTREQAFDSIYGTGEFAGMGMGYESFLYTPYTPVRNDGFIQSALELLSVLHTQYARSYAWMEVNGYCDYAGNPTDAASAEYVEFIIYR